MNVMYIQYKDHLKLLFFIVWNDVFSIFMVCIFALWHCNFFGLAPVKFYFCSTWGQKVILRGSWAQWVGWLSKFFITKIDYLSCPYLNCSLLVCFLDHYLHCNIYRNGALLSGLPRVTLLASQHCFLKRFLPINCWLNIAVSLYNNWLWKQNNRHNSLSSLLHIWFVYVILLYLICYITF